MSAERQSICIDVPRPGADYFQYCLTGELPGDVQLLCVPEAREWVSVLGGSVVRDLVEEAILTATHDPFGDHSIDLQKDTDAGRMERIVHKLDEAAEEKLGAPVAIKGTGLFPEGSIDPSLRPRPQRHDLVRQFKLMRTLSSAQQLLYPKGIADGLITFARPLAVISYASLDPTPKPPKQEWLFMDRVVGGESVRQYEDPDRPFQTRGFSADEYPELAAYAADFHPDMVGRDGMVLFARLALPIARDLAPAGIQRDHLQDIKGPNMLETQRTDGTLSYTIIDVQSPLLAQLPGEAGRYV